MLIARSAQMEDVSIYWDRVDKAAPAGSCRKVLFSTLAPAALMTAFADGIAGSGVGGSGGGAGSGTGGGGSSSRPPLDHTYVLEPCSPSVTLTTNPQMKVGHAKVKFAAQLNMVRYSIGLCEWRFVWCQRCSGCGVKDWWSCRVVLPRSLE